MDEQLTHSQRSALLTVYENVRGARAILFTISIICGFLFILIFEQVFGWQPLRPSASQEIFAQQLATIAKGDMSRDRATNPNPLCEALTSLALNHCGEILDRDSITVKKLVDKDSIGYALDNRLDALATWQSEWYLRSFVEELNLIDSMDIKLDSLNGYATSLKKLETLRLPHRIAFALQEVRDRYRVNEETRGRRVGRRKYQLPLIGASLQIEDVFGPVSIILAFMVIWLKGAFSKAGESILICRQFFPDRSKLAPLVANAFFFLEWRPLGKNVQGNLRFHQRIIVFLLAPYLVIACGIIAYILDNVFLDYQQHCSTETFDSSPIRILVGWIIPVMLFAASMCAVSAWQMFKELHNVAIRLSRDLPKGAGTLRTQTTDLKRCYCWMVASPFLILGNFVVLSYLSGAYSRDYFPSTGYLVVFLTCLSITVFASAKLLTCKPEDLTKPAPIWTFLYWTTPLVIVLAFLYTVCSQEWNYVVLNKYLFIAAASLFAATVAMGIWMSLWVSKAPSKSDC